MRECVCLSCKNFKTSIDDQGEVIKDEYECVHDFPSDNCAECELDMCELECQYYISDEEADVLVTKKCATCGKELQVVDYHDNNQDPIYCIDCFL